MSGLVKSFSPPREGGISELYSARRSYRSRSLDWLV